MAGSIVNGAKALPKKNERGEEDLDAAIMRAASTVLQGWNSTKSWFKKMTAKTPAATAAAAAAPAQPGAAVMPEAAANPEAVAAVAAVVELGVAEGKDDGNTEEEEEEEVEEEEEEKEEEGAEPVEAAPTADEPGTEAATIEKAEE